LLHQTIPKRIILKYDECPSWLKEETKLGILNQGVMGDFT
jgi:hypothetical protein